jgi:hypothetical protein
MDKNRNGRDPGCWGRRFGSLSRIKNYNLVRDVGGFEIAETFMADYKCFLISSGKRK